jgi:REP element-mobilizing transposase RayT
MKANCRWTPALDVAGLVEPGRNMAPRHSHLTRLGNVWQKSPTYFLTVCTAGWNRGLANLETSSILLDEWTAARKFHGWHVGSYVIMPDHVHFLAVPEAGAVTLASFVGRWKEWTAKRLIRQGVLGAAPVWQPEFFDHVLRSSDSYSKKWDYVRQNPVRAGLVKNADAWPFSGHVHYR